MEDDHSPGRRELEESDKNHTPAAARGDAYGWESGPADTDPGPERRKSIIRASTPFENEIDPTAFDSGGPSVSTFTSPNSARNTPVSSDADEILLRLRRGDYSDVDLCVDEFDEHAPTQEVDRGSALENLSRASVGDGPDRNRVSSVSRRGVESDHAREEGRPLDSSSAPADSGARELEALLIEYSRAQSMVRTADDRMADLLSEYLGKDSPTPLDRLLRDYVTDGGTPVVRGRDKKLEE